MNPIGQKITKGELIEEFRRIAKKGWIKGGRPGNDGSVGNTIEDLLGIPENNLPIANAVEWELKAQRRQTSSLTTLFHFEPEPRSAGIVPKVLLPRYGWMHQTISDNEKSFRQTIAGGSFTDRGFGIVVDREKARVELRFNSKRADQRHAHWLEAVKNTVGFRQLRPIPYWSFESLETKVREKLKNAFFLVADTKIEKGVEYFHYDELWLLFDASFSKFLEVLERGIILVDFDARTHHNHGTKFRIRQNSWLELYAHTEKVF